MTTRTTTRTTALGILAASAILLGAAGCSSDDEGGEDTTTTTAAAADDSSTTTAGDEPAAGPVEIAIGESDLGEILVDGDGMTLYLTEADTDGTPTCVDACADAWPPLIGEATVGDGLDESLLGTAEREDGSTQVTYNGHPLYYFAADAAPGDTEGQEVGGVWYVLDPAGNAIDVHDEGEEGEGESDGGGEGDGSSDEVE